MEQGLVAKNLWVLFLFFEKIYYLKLRNNNFDSYDCSSYLIRIFRKSNSVKYFYISSYKHMHYQVFELVRYSFRISETFDEVTILFTDIVTFTNIASAVKPIQIVDMLNALYSQYDELTNQHEVYKV